MNINDNMKDYLLSFQKIREGIQQGDNTWEDVINLRYKYNMPSLSKDTIRKGVLFYDEFNKANCINVNKEESLNIDVVSNKEITEINKDGSITSDKIVLLENKNTDTLLKSHGFNPLEYELVSAKNSKWQQNSKTGLKNLYSSRITVKPRKIILDPKWYEEILNNIEINHKKENPIYNSYSRTGEMLVVAFDDLHWGRFSWEAETAVDYNLEIARKRILNNASKIINKFKNRKFEKIILKLGSDFLNSNSNGVTTAHKNPQDNDGTYKKIFSNGIEILISLIDMFSKVSPIKVIWINGNHGEMEDFFMSKCLECYYSNDKSVTIDARPIPRKYLEFGTNLIGFMHGDKEKKENIPNIMACEVPELWAKTSEHVFITGHLHNCREKTFEENGVTVFTVPTIVADDVFTINKGYKAKKRTMCFVFDRKEGLVETHYIGI